MNKTITKASASKRNLWAIAWMSFLWSSSTMMFFSVLPTYLTQELKVTHFQVGMIEGFAIFSAFAAKVFAGVGSDIYKQRKPFILIGTIFTVVARIMLALSINFWGFFFARFLDRLSKGIRSAPSDALVADCSRLGNFGRDFGIRQSISMFGAVFGALLAMIIMYLTGNNFRLAFQLAVIPAILSLVVLFFFVKDRVEFDQDFKKELQNKTTKKRFEFSEIRLLPLDYWKIIFVTFILMLTRFSEAFLTLRFTQLGLTATWLPGVIILSDLIHASVAIPSGFFSDGSSKINVEERQKKILKRALIVFFMSHMTLAFANTIFVGGIGLIFQGIHLGMTQGLLRAMIAACTPQRLNGTAFAIFYMVSAVGILLSNLLAGHLSDIFGVKGAFGSGTIFCMLTIILVQIFWPKNKREALA